MRILLIEDDTSLRGFLKESFEAEHFSVDAVGDGERASYLARTNQYDLIILDNILPGRTGTEVCREMRALGKTFPILMITVQSEIAQKVEVLNLGADDYLTKPFALEELLARVRTLLRRPPAIVNEILEVGDLRLDIQSYQVERRGKNIYLTRKEFELLEYLMRNKNKVMSRGLIMEHVWDMNADPFSNTIETHILNLRRKLEKNQKKKLIHTVPGRGYKITEYVR